MGHFLAVTAIRSESTQEVTRAVCDYLKSHAVDYELVPATTPLSEDRDAQLLAPSSGWSVVVWPTYFNVHDFALAKSLASREGWLISTVHVYDGDYWEHLALQGSTELHAYCSRPNYWADEPTELARVSAFDSSPNRLASAIGVPASALAPYLVDVDALSPNEGKAQPSDRFALDDFWVFTDFWRQLGIAYPDLTVTAASVVIRLSRWFGKRLPSV